MPPVRRSTRLATAPSPTRTRSGRTLVAAPLGRPVSGKRKSKKDDPKTKNKRKEEPPPEPIRGRPWWSSPTIPWIVTLACYAISGLQESYWQCHNPGMFHDLAKYIHHDLSQEQLDTISRVLDEEFRFTQEAHANLKSQGVTENDQVLKRLRSRHVKQAAFAVASLLIVWMMEDQLLTVSLFHVELDYEIFGTALPELNLSRMKSLEVFYNKINYAPPKMRGSLNLFKAIPTDVLEANPWLAKNQDEYCEPNSGQPPLPLFTKLPPPPDTSSHPDQPTEDFDDDPSDAELEPDPHWLHPEQFDSPDSPTLLGNLDRAGLSHVYLLSDIRVRLAQFRKETEGSMGMALWQNLLCLKALDMLLPPDWKSGEIEDPVEEADADDNRAAYVASYMDGDE